jgi:hypothetical protein
MSARRWVIAAALLVLAGVGAFFLFQGPETVKRVLPPPPPKADFKAVEVRAVDVHDREEANQKANEQTQHVITLLNNFYQAGFLTPEPPEKLAGFFTAESQPSVATNLGALALAELAPRFERVDPTRQEASRISFEISDDLSAPNAVVSVAFEADGKTKNPQEGPVKIVHSTVLWLTLEGDSYKIWAYATELKADTQVQAASFGVPQGWLEIK